MIGSRGGGQRYIGNMLQVSLWNTGGMAIPIKLSLESFPRKDVIYAEETIEVESSKLFMNQLLLPYVVTNSPVKKKASTGRQIGKTFSK